MERMEAEDFLQELESYSPRQFDLMNPLMDLTSGRKNLMSKYLELNEEEPWPLLAEYFGVALAFAALGALIRGSNGNREADDLGKDTTTTTKAIPQRTALQTMLKGAMERLQFLAQNAQDLQERLFECADARTDWEAEKMRFLQRIAEAEDEVKELKKRRGDDGKANEKVVRIYANREHGWKNEKKKLRHEIDMLRKDLIRQEASGFSSVGDRVCDECELKERRLIDLEKILKEKEFIIMSAMDDARGRESECAELTDSVAAEKAVSAELRQALETETTNSATLRDANQEMECRLVKVQEELTTTNSHLGALSLATEDHSAMTQKLLKELGTLRQESEDRDAMISTMLDRATVEREEKEDIARELAAAVTGKQTAEAESARWKRLAEKRSQQKLFVEVPDARSRHRSHRSLGNGTSELEKVADLHKSHVEEVNNLRAAYSRHVEALEHQVAGYRASSPMPGLMSPDLLGPLADPAIKAWFEVVKGRFATQLEEKHWNQIETFERHLRAKDERLAAFRAKLMELESDLAQSSKEAQGCNSSDHVTQAGECAACETTAGSMEKLENELKIARDKVNEQSAGQAAAVEKMTQSFHADLQQKDEQLAVVEAKLCQLQLQLEETKMTSDLASDKSEEETFLDNIDETAPPQPEEESADVKTEVVEIVASKPDVISCEEFIKLDDTVSDSAKLLSRLKDMCLKEEKPPAMIRFHRKLELETADSLIFSADDCWLTAEQTTGEMALQFVPADETVKNVTSRDTKALVVHKNGKAKIGVNKQPLSPGRAVKPLPKFKDILFTQAPAKGSRPARFDMSNVLDEQKSQRVLFTDIEGLQSPITNPTFIQESDYDEDRKKSTTREDIQVLGLALEVRRIEQQLSHMNESLGDVARSVRTPTNTPVKPAAKTPAKQTKRYTGLAGKVSQLAKHIGLTRKAAPKETPVVKKECASVRSLCKSGPSAFQTADLCLRKNPLFLQESSAADLAMLQKRAEKVGENLTAIQARFSKERSSPYKPSLFPKGKLVDTVRTHLSQVQGALHSKLSQTSVNNNARVTKHSSALTPRKLVSPPGAKPTALTPRKQLLTPTKPATPARKPFSPTNSILTPSPRRITSTKLLTPSPRPFTPRKPGHGSPTKPSQTVNPKIATMRDLIRADPRSRAAFPRKTAALQDQQPRQWARKTSSHHELDLDHLR